MCDWGLQDDISKDLENRENRNISSYIIFRSTGYPSQQDTDRMYAKTIKVDWILRKGLK